MLGSTVRSRTQYKVRAEVRPVGWRVEDLQDLSHEFWDLGKGFLGLGLGGLGFI